jgi:hypothetical protein
MKYLFLLLLTTINLVAQDSPLAPAKRLVTSGNDNVTVGQVVAGYSNDYHVGIRIPFRRITTKVQENAELSWLIYPNPSSGMANIQTENLKSAEVSDIFGTIWYQFDSVSGGNGGTRTFNIKRGTYFVKMTTLDGRVYSTIFIVQ